MILTITPNSALDRVIFVEAFRPETVMRTQRMVNSVGGKGFDTSVVLQALGARNLALGFVAGETGEALQKLLDGYGIAHDLIWTGGETRIAHVIVETSLRRFSHITAGQLAIADADIEALYTRTRSHLADADWLACGGSLPPGAPAALFRDLVRLAQERGVPALVDSSGPPLLAALEAKPAILKMNRDEFHASFGAAVETDDALLAAAREVCARHGLPAMVITCGKDGIFLLAGDEGYHAAAPAQTVVNGAGAGDAVSAALAWRLSQGDSWAEALRWAAAAGAAVVLTEGTADCHLTDIDRIRPQVQVRPL